MELNPNPATQHGFVPQSNQNILQSNQNILATVRLFSGCRDPNTSAEVPNTNVFNLPENSGPGGRGGACTNSMLSHLHGKPNSTWLDLLMGMRSVLKARGYSQIPQLSTSHKLDLFETFDLECTQQCGKKVSLLIGINYIGQQGELGGCHNDVLKMQRFIKEKGFHTDNQLVLLDDGNHIRPTYRNILKAFDWLADKVKAGDSLFLFYSGHGGSVPDSVGKPDELDMKDEAIVPVDCHSEAELIRDDLILKELVQKLPKGSKLTGVMDCCHSATILDLPYIFVADDDKPEIVKDWKEPHEIHENAGFFLKKQSNISTNATAPQDG